MEQNNILCKNEKLIYSIYKKCLKYKLHFFSVLNLEPKEEKIKIMDIIDSKVMNEDSDSEVMNEDSDSTECINLRSRKVTRNCNNKCVRCERIMDSREYVCDFCVSFLNDSRDRNSDDYCYGEKSMEFMKEHNFTTIQVFLMFAVHKYRLLKNNSSSSKYKYKVFLNKQYKRAVDLQEVYDENKLIKRAIKRIRSRINKKLKDGDKKNDYEKDDAFFYNLKNLQKNSGLSREFLIKNCKFKTKIVANKTILYFNLFSVLNELFEIVENSF